jgi:hypothetical protein
MTMFDLQLLPVLEFRGSPVSLVGCVVFLLFPLFFMYLLHRSIMGEIGCATAILMSLTSMYLLGVIWKIDHPVAHWGALFGILSMVVGIPVLGKISEKIDDKNFQNEQIATCYQQIRMNPQNAMAAYRLAKVLYTKGESSYAIAIAGKALEHLPKQYWRNEHHEFARWVQQSPNANITEVLCVACQKTSPASALICQHCLGSIHLDRARKGSLVHNKRAQKIVAIWASVMILIFAIPLAGQFPPQYAIPAILVLCAVAMWAIATAFGLGLQNT